MLLLMMLEMKGAQDICRNTIKTSAVPLLSKKIRRRLHMETANFLVIDKQIQTLVPETCLHVPTKKRLTRVALTKPAVELMIYCITVSRILDRFLFRLVPTQVIECVLIGVTAIG